MQPVLDKIFSSAWDSSGLDDENNFTQMIVMRMAGFLARHKIVPEPEIRVMVKKGKTVEQRVRDVGKSAPRSFRVKDYRPTPVLAYWFLDAIDSVSLDLPTDSWDRLVSWASQAFARQLSLVTARHDAMMDPVAMAMAACCVARIKRMASTSRLKVSTEVAQDLPSTLELLNSTDLLFQHQGGSGIWPKYFPLFHYPDAGANFCFTFELLEAVLAEFGTQCLLQPIIISGLGKAVDWCEKNRLVYKFDGKTYCGWNSGGQLNTLNAGIPECWPTGVVHMFLSRLTHVISGAIQAKILTKYDAHREQKEDPWKNFLDITVEFPKESPEGLKFILEQEIIDHVKDVEEPVSDNWVVEGRRSGLLFGPPGTSKTQLARALAAKIDWPFVEITPSHFLKRGLEEIYVRADEIFEDLLDLSRAVILFDEMDALVQQRQVETDVIRQFLTTSMLPKLAKLHDRKRTIFFMATNHQKNFDDAIKRPGRFDLLICMGPPRWQEKINGLKVLLPKEIEKQAPEIARRLQALIDGDRALIQGLHDFTFNEIQAFFEHLCKQKGKALPKLREALADYDKDEFSKVIRTWHDEYITLRPKDKRKRNPLVVEYKNDIRASRRQ